MTLYEISNPCGKWCAADCEYCSTRCSVGTALKDKLRCEGCNTSYTATGEERYCPKCGQELKEV